MQPDKAPIAVTARIGTTRCTSTTWLSQSSLRCVTPRAGERNADARVVSVETTVACPSHNTWSGCTRSIRGESPDIFDYAPPTIDAVKPRDDVATVGVATVTLIGASFGYADPSAMVTVGDSACQHNQWVSDTSLKCKLPLGSGRDKTIKMRMPGGSSGSLQSGFSFRPALELSLIHI